MKKIIIIAVVAVLVFSGALGGLFALYNTPERVAARAVTGVVEDLLKRDELAPLGNVLTKGSIAFEAESKTFSELVGEDLSVDGKLYFSENAFMLDDLNVKIAKSELSGSIYLDENRFYVQNPEIMNGVWGVERGTLEEEWKNSVFAPKSGTDMALEEGVFNTISEFLAAYDEGLDRELQKDLEKLLKRYGKKAWEVFCENAEFESESGSVRINKERKNARTITITLDGDAIGVIVEDMVDYIVKDKKLKELVIEYGDRFADALEEYYDIEDIADSYDELMEELEDSADDIVDSVELAVQDDIIITLVTPTLTSDLLMLTAEYDDTEILAVEFGHEGIRKTDCITVKAGGVFEIAYNISENNKDEYKANLEVEGKKVATIEIDKDKESYELELIDLCEIKGDMSTKGKVHTLTVDSVTVDGEKFDKLGITLTFNEKDKMPEPEDDIKCLLTLDEKELKEWGDRLKEMNILESFGFLSGTYTAESAGTGASFTFSGNKVTMNVIMMGSSIAEYEGTYEIVESSYGSDKIRLDVGYVSGLYLFEKGDGYIKIDGERYDRKDTK